MKKISFLIFLLGLFGGLTAQNLTFYGFLPAVSQTGRISNRVDYNFFGSTTIDAFRSTIGGTEYPAKDLQLYIQPSVVYKFSPNFNTSCSYTYQRNNPLTADFGNEHRIWEQFIYAHSFSKYRFTNRVRFEQRFIENRTNKTYPMSTRLRYQLGLNFPLQGKTLEKNEFYVNAYNEFYFSLTGNKNATYSENWTYVGIGYHLGKAGRLEIGYLLQMAVRDAKKDIRRLNLCQVSWITNFNVKRKAK
jgi:hypothetical protein